MIKKKLFLFFVLLFSVQSLAARTIGEVEFKDEIKIDAKELELKSFTKFTFAVFYDVLVAGIYMEKPAKLSQVLSPLYAKRLEIEYFRNFKREEFISAANTFIAKNSSKALVKKYQSKIDKFNSFYQNIKPGDRYAINYFPGKGISLLKNNKLLGTVKSDGLSSLIFKIWLGDKPFREDLKSGLLTPLK